jgi:hypothetical protein
VTGSAAQIERSQGWLLPGESDDLLEVSTLGMHLAGQVILGIRAELVDRQFLLIHCCLSVFLS